LTDSNIDDGRNEDWTFASADTRYSTHGLHSYPARMIPQIARRLILRYSHEGDLIWDPFCGSGTVLVESMLLSRRSIGTDLNPFAVFLAQVKTRPIEPSTLQRVSDSVIGKVKSLQKTAERKGAIPDIPNVDYWFKSYVQRDLVALRNTLDSVQDPVVRSFLKLCFGLTVREVSNLKKREFKIVRMSASKLEDFQPDVFASFEAQVRRCVPLMEAFTPSGMGSNVEVRAIPC
jgi:site-specific DNA-methyltransferase (cytosine-N4-specific)